MQEDSSLRRDLIPANRVISEHRGHFRAMANMFDLMVESNPALSDTWQILRPTFIPDPTPEEQADLERQAEQHGSDLFDEINLNA
ncbi:hypothetical protein Bca4012_064897 [Brassica carinata]